MSINKRPLHFAHSEGHTDLCYTEDGRTIITCGSDGDIRIWAGIDDTDPLSHSVGDEALSVAQKGDDIYVCRSDGKVSIMTMEGQRNGNLTRFTASATHVIVGKKQSFICCAGEDFLVRVFTSPQDTQCTEFSDLKGPALGVTISPNEDVIAASCGDGNVYIWNLEKKTLIKTIECVPRTNSFTTAKVLCRVSFNPKEKYFAYPHDKEVIIVSTETYEKIFSLKNDEIQVSFSIVQFSPCGNFIAATSINGDICIWPCKAGGSAVSVTHEQKYNICAFEWHPDEMGEIVYCDVTGQIGSLEYIPSGEHFTSPDDVITDADLNMIPAADADDDDDDTVISLDKLKNETLGDFRPNSAGGSDSRAGSPERPSSPPCNLQVPFQPNATPYHLQKRFMAYNELGIVRLYKDEDYEETGISSIDLTFHDASFYKSLYMKNLLNHTMASLSTAALALACDAPSKLVVIPLKVGTKEWSIELPELEEILCVAASSTLIAVGTTIRMLRVFSVYGTQRTVLSVPGPLVSIAAQNHYILVIYHGCTAYSKDQHLSGMLVHLNEYNVTSKIIPIPITPQATLKWVGFTDLGSLATYDTAGILRICKLNSGAWIPVCDTTTHAKGVSDTFYVTSVIESEQNIHAAHCRGTMYPAAVPLPVLAELPMQLPMCELDTDKTQFEEKICRLSFFQSEQNERANREAAIKLFALACKNDLDDRAYEILEIINSSSLANLLVKYAAKLGKHRLVEKLQELAQNIDGVYVAKEKTPIVSNKHRLNTQSKERKEKEKEKESTQSIESQPQTETQQTFTPDLFVDNTLTDTQTQNIQSPSPFKSKINPFKKNPKNNEKKQNLIEDVSQVTTPTKSKEKENKQSERESFQVWFDRERPGIKKEHPHLSDQDIVRAAVKLFKKQAEKRKATDDAEHNTQHKSKQSKLSSFAFTKE